MTVFEQTAGCMKRALVTVIVALLVVPYLRQLWCIPVLFFLFWSTIVAMDQRQMLANAKGFTVPGFIPLLGHVNIVTGSELRLFRTLRQNVERFGRRYILFILNEYTLNISDAASVEIILSCTKNITKSQFNSFLHPWIGQGLLTSTGQHWATHRKLLTPAFHFSILEKLAPRLQHHSEKFAETLEEMMRKDPNGAVDLVPQITKTTLAAILEVAMGVDIKEAGDGYIQAVRRMGASISKRVTCPWLWSDFVYSLFPKGRQLKKDLKILHGFSAKVIAERKAFFQLKLEEKNPSTDSDENEVGIRKKLTFLDLMLTAQQNGAKITDEDIRNEVDTIMNAGHDTTAMSIFWTLYLLADLPEIQERLREEVKSVQLEETPNLPYLNRVIRESLRLFPIVPFLSRKIEHPLKLGENQVVVPPMAINIHVFDLHRDPEQFPDPLKFDPDREYPTHPFAYVPFSGGSRNCIGRRLALLELKLVVAATLRRLRLRKPPIPHLEVPIPTDLLLRPGEIIKVPLEAI